jgi:RNA polymerase sigma-70 factor (ECF subfamily)
VTLSNKDLFDQLDNIDNEKLFDQIFKEFYSPLCVYSRKIVGDIDNAEDVVQGFFVEFWKNRHSLNITSSLKSYLFKSIYNRSLNHLRNNKSKEAYNKYIKGSLMIEPNTDQDLLVIDELEKRILDTIHSLKEPTKQIFLMSRHEDLKYREIAKEMEISIKTVESHMTKALRILAQNLAHYLPVFLVVVKAMFDK